MNIEKVLGFCICSTLFFINCLGMENKATLPTIWKPVHTAEVPKSSMSKTSAKLQIQLTEPVATAKFMQTAGQKKLQFAAHTRRKSRISVTSSTAQLSHLPPIHQPVTDSPVVVPETSGQPIHKPTTTPESPIRSPRTVRLIKKQPTLRLNLSEHLKSCERYYPNKAGELIDSLFPYKEGQVISGGTEYYNENVFIDGGIELIKHHAHNASKGVFLSVFSLKSNQNIVCIDYANSSQQGVVPGYLTRELCENTDLRTESDLWIPLEIMQDLYPEMNFDK